LSMDKIALLSPAIRLAYHMLLDFDPSNQLSADSNWRRSQIHRHVCSENANPVIEAPTIFRVLCANFRFHLSQSSPSSSKSRRIQTSESAPRQQEVCSNSQSGCRSPSPRPEAANSSSRPALFFFQSRRRTLFPRSSTLCSPQRSGTISPWERRRFWNRLMSRYVPARVFVIVVEPS
jgi:hypothetical protein